MKSFYKPIFLLFLNSLFLLFAVGIPLDNSFSQQAPGIEWQKCLGGSDWDRAACIQLTSDGGYIVAGYAISNDSDVTGNHGGGGDIWIVKLNNSGSIQWQKCLGGSNTDLSNLILQTPDNGYIIAGTTYSNDGDVSGNHSFSPDAWIVKLDSVGTIQWQKCLGGSSDENASSVILMPDGGYTIAGTTHSNNFDVSGNHGGWDVWVVQLDNAGNIQWQKCYGGTGMDVGLSICRTDDSGFIFAGPTFSVDGDVSGNHGGFDYWVVKIDSIGNLQWQKCFGGTDEDNAYDVKQTHDKGCIVVGSVNSSDGNVTGNHGLNDGWIVKLDSTGTLQWEKCLGGTSGDEGQSVKLTQDDGYIIAGGSNSTDGDVSGLHGFSSDLWIVKIDSLGNIKWENCFGGTSLEDAPEFIEQTPDKGFIVACSTNSNDGDVSGNNGGISDYWIIKLTPDTVTSVSNLQPLTSNFEIVPNPSNGIFQITFPLSSNQKTNYTLEVINTLAQIVFRSTHSAPGREGVRLDLSFLPKGIYVVKMRDSLITGSRILIVN